MKSSGCSTESLQKHLIKFNIKHSHLESSVSATEMELSTISTNVSFKFHLFA